MSWWQQWTAQSSLYDILAEYFETFIHKEEHDIKEGNTVKFVLDTSAAFTKGGERRKYIDVR